MAALAPGWIRQPDGSERRAARAVRPNPAETGRSSVTKPKARGNKSLKPLEQADAVVEDSRFEVDLGPGLSGKIIELSIGPTGTQLFVHEATLKATSAFFAAALNSDFREAKEGKVVLPEEDPAHVTLYTQWLYTHRIHTGTLKSSQNFEHDYNILASLYALGERLRDPAFQDHLIDTMITEVLASETHKDIYLPDHEAINTIFANTMPGDPVRRLLVDMHVLHALEDWFDENTGLGDPNFVEELARGLLREKGLLGEKGDKAKTVLVDPKSGSCKYHHHGAKELCSVSRKRKRT